MPSELRRVDEPGHCHFWTISSYRRLQFFHDDGMKLVVISAFSVLRERFGICLMAYVIMPDHLHLVLYPHRKSDEALIPVGLLLRTFMQHVGFHCKERLRSVWRNTGRLWSDPLNRWARGEFGKQDILHERGYDRNIFTEAELREKVDYIHQNPIRRGLVETAGEWKWSSYRYFSTRDRSVIAMDWNGEWPIEW